MGHTGVLRRTRSTFVAKLRCTLTLAKPAVWFQSSIPHFRDAVGPGSGSRVRETVLFTWKTSLNTSLKCLKIKGRWNLQNNQQATAELARLPFSSSPTPPPPATISRANRLKMQSRGQFRMLCQRCLSQNLSFEEVTGTLPGWISCHPTQFP